MRPLLLAALALLLALPPRVHAEPEPEPSEPLTLAVFDFATDPAGPGGNQIATLLAARLAGEPGLRLVERQELDRVLGELSLGASGLVDGQAAEAGRLLGAKLLLVGRAFTLGQESHLVARLIGTETGLVHPVAVSRRTEADGAAGPLVADLADALGPALSGARALLPQEVEDPLAERTRTLRDAIAAAGDEPPTVRVRITEEHLRPGPSDAAPDPAAETELLVILQRAGFQPVDGPVGADWTLTGEAFSEPGPRRGDFHAGLARIEWKLTRASSGVDGGFTTGRATARRADLGEQLAAKAALAAAARECAAEVLDALLAAVEASAEDSGAPAAEQERVP